MKRIIYRPAALCAAAFFAFSVFLSYTGAAMCRILLPVSLVLLAGILIFCFWQKIRRSKQRQASCAFLRRFRHRRRLCIFCICLK